MRKRLALITIAAAAGLAGIAGLGGSAAASGEQSPAPVTGHVKYFATSFVAPSDRTAPIHHLDPETTVDAYCFRNGQAHGDQAAWIAISHGGEPAWLHADALSVPQLPYC